MIEKDIAEKGITDALARLKEDNPVATKAAVVILENAAGKLLDAVMMREIAKDEIRKAFGDTN